MNIELRHLRYFVGRCRRVAFWSGGSTIEHFATAAKPADPNLEQQVGADSPN
ncbi:hypothetical protein ACNKHK_10270 [Shigella flexneri]